MEISLVVSLNSNTRNKDTPFLCNPKRDNTYLSYAYTHAMYRHNTISIKQRTAGWQPFGSVRLPGTKGAEKEKKLSVKKEN